MAELMLVLLFIGSIAFWIEAQQAEKEMKNVYLTRMTNTPILDPRAKKGLADGEMR